MATMSTGSIGGEESILLIPALPVPLVEGEPLDIEGSKMITRREDQYL